MSGEASTCSRRTVVVVVTVTFEVVVSRVTRRVGGLVEKLAKEHLGSEYLIGLCARRGNAESEAEIGSGFRAS